MSCPIVIKEGTTPNGHQLRFEGVYSPGQTCLRLSVLLGHCILVFCNLFHGLLNEVDKRNIMNWFIDQQFVLLNNKSAKLPLSCNTVCLERFVADF